MFDWKCNFLVNPLCPVGRLDGLSVSVQQFSMEAGKLKFNNPIGVLVRVLNKEVNQESNK